VRSFIGGASVLLLGIGASIIFRPDNSLKTSGYGIGCVLIGLASTWIIERLGNYDPPARPPALAELIHPDHQPGGAARKRKDERRAMACAAAETLSASTSICFC